MMIMEDKHLTTGEASGKLILLGEHAVVHGEPAVAVPFTPVGVKAHIQYKEGPIRLACSIYTGPLDQVPEYLQGIYQCIYRTLDFLEVAKKDLLISLDSTIPLGRGLGSSAAVAVATVRGLFQFFNQSFTHQELMTLVNVSEAITHGQPSGIDAEAVTSKGVIWYRKGHPPESLQVKDPFYLVVADSGYPHDTRAAVQAVQERLDKTPQKIKSYLHQLGQLSRRTRAALLQGNVHDLGQAFREAQEHLVEMGVSDDHLNRLISIANQAGALGSKLTGSGRGGCFFALAKTLNDANEIKRALKSAGAVQAWDFTLGATR